MPTPSAYEGAYTILFGSVSSALVVCHVFRRYEPDNIPAHLLLIAFPPTLSSILLLPHYSFLKAVFFSFVTHVGTLLVLTAIYRLSPIHPLSRYPGPFYLKLSKLSLMWIANKGVQYKYVKRLHERYGDIVRTGPNEISIRDPSALVGVHTLPKGPQWINSKMSWSPNSLIAENNLQEHARRRKPWNRAFNIPALKGYEELISNRASELVDKLAMQESAVDLGMFIDYFSYDFMSDMAFGGGSEMIKQGESGSNWHALSAAFAFSHPLGHIPWIVIYARRLPALARQIQRMIKLGAGQAARRLKAGSLRRDLFYYLNNEDGVEPAAPPFPEIVSNGALAIIAGSETTSSSLAHLFYFILKDKQSYKRLQEEVDRFFPPRENALDTTQLAKMPFLNAVINETIRVIPVVPNGSKRRVEKGTGGRTAGPYYLPEETQVSIHFWSMHRDPRNFFPAPEEFWPDRWLIAAQSQSQSDSKSGKGGGVAAVPRPAGFVHKTDAYVPFSFGPNNCAAKALAIQEMRMVTALLMQKFEMRFAEGWDANTYEGKLKDFFTFQRGTLMVQLWLRHA